MRRFVVRGGSARAIRAGHPWVFASSVEEGDPVPGGAPGDEAPDVALVEDERGQTLGRGLVSEGSALRIRLVDTAPGPASVDDRLAARIAAACALRRTLFPRASRTDVHRLVHAEGDGLPGLVVDRFGDVLAAQFATAPLVRRRAALADALLRHSGARSLLARAGGYEAVEGIAPDEVPFTVGAPVGDAIRGVEAGMVLEIDPHRGQKTGHYADQRENRLHVAQLAAGARVLDLYAGTGGFSVQALRHGARAVLAVESSERAVAASERTAMLNAVAPGLETWPADVRRALEDLKAAGRTFDVVVVDPPNFFPRRGGDGLAQKAYREVNVKAMTRVVPGGLFATFCCSARLSAAAFLEIVLAAARECRRAPRILRTLAAGPDHPVLAAAPEGRYLSGVLAVLD